LRRRTIPYRDASVAATFFEPAYQRLRLWSDGRFVNLLCFVRELRPALRSLLEGRGACPSRTFSAPCFAEVWELPSREQSAGVSRTEECELDQQISEVLGCLDGKYSAAAGTLFWGDVHGRSERRPFISRLLHESQAKRWPSR
jgi:hypothetical protein